MSENKNQLFGVPVFESKWLPSERVQIRKPKSKKRRIQKKWARREENWQEYEMAVFINPSYFLPKPVWPEMKFAQKEKFVEPYGCCSNPEYFYINHIITGE